jgi:hypothetical protein
MAPPQLQALLGEQAGLEEYEDLARQLHACLVQRYGAPTAAQVGCVVCWRVSGWRADARVCAWQGAAPGPSVRGRLCVVVQTWQQVARCVYAATTQTV